MTRLQQRIYDILKHSQVSNEHPPYVTVDELSILLNKPRMVIRQSLTEMARHNSAISYNGEKAYIVRSEWPGYLMAVGLIMIGAYSFVVAF